MFILLSGVITLGLAQEKTSDGKYWISTTSDGKSFQVFETATNELVSKIDLPGPVYLPNLCLIDNDTRVLAPAIGEVYIIDFEKQEITGTVELKSFEIDDGFITKFKDIRTKYHTRALMEEGVKEKKIPKLAEEKVEKDLNDIQINLNVLRNLKSLKGLTSEQYFYTSDHSKMVRFIPGVYLPNDSGRYPLKYSAIVEIYSTEGLRLLESFEMVDKSYNYTHLFGMSEKTYPATCFMSDDNLVFGKDTILFYSLNDMKLFHRFSRLDLYKRIYGEEKLPELVKKGLASNENWKTQMNIARMKGLDDLVALVVIAQPDLAGAFVLSAANGGLMQLWANEAMITGDYSKALQSSVFLFHPMTLEPVAGFVNTTSVVLSADAKYASVTRIKEPLSTLSSTDPGYVEEIGNPDNYFIDIYALDPEEKIGTLDNTMSGFFQDGIFHAVRSHQNRKNLVFNLQTKKIEEN